MKADRKQLLRDYRERKTSAGVFAVRCTTTGEVWVGTTADLATRQNGVWFPLRQGSHPNRGLQSVWTAEGEAAFAFEILEALPDEERTAWVQAAQLKDRQAHWRTTLKAGAVTG
ncbi:MAG: GIY-YIG nuclease family protein [Caulobacter sp.]|nr:GIY-YIG nuclease family protein [Caulobacter sp.]